MNMVGNKVENRICSIERSTYDALSNRILMLGMLVIPKSLHETKEAVQIIARTLQISLDLSMASFCARSCNGTEMHDVLRERAVRSQVVH